MPKPKNADWDKLFDEVSSMQKEILSMGKRRLAIKKRATTLFNIVSRKQAKSTLRSAIGQTELPVHKKRSLNSYIHRMKNAKKILVAKGYEDIKALNHPKATSTEYAWVVVIKDTYPQERIDFERSLGLTTGPKPGSTLYHFHFSKSLKNANQRLEVIRSEEYKKIEELCHTDEQLKRFSEARSKKWTTREVVEAVESETAVPLATFSAKKKRPKWFQDHNGRQVRLFSQDELKTPEQHEVNTLILEEASDIAEKMTELECQKAGIECWIGDEQSKTFTEEAQSIFDVHYDKQVDALYSLLNAQIKAIANNQK